jgi:protein-S-isoprenylcysteine O-methyltransferase Ste14
LYVGTWLCFVAFLSPYLPAVVAVAFATAFALCLRAIAVFEESALRATFGAAFNAYALAVPRFVGIAKSAPADDVKTTWRSWMLAALSNVGMASVGVYRVLKGEGVDFRGLGLANVLCLVLWLLVVVTRRLWAHGARPETQQTETQQPETQQTETQP